jgi:hypothetical protein
VLEEAFIGRADSLAIRDQLNMSQQIGLQTLEQRNWRVAIESKLCMHKVLPDVVIEKHLSEAKQ